MLCKILLKTKINFQLSENSVPHLVMNSVPHLVMNTLQPMYLPSTEKPKHTTVTPQKSRKRRSQTGMILGVVVSGFMLLLLILILLYKRYRGRRQLKFSDPDIG